MYTPLSLALVGSLIKLQIGTLECLGLFYVCSPASPQQYPIGSPDVHSLALLFSPTNVCLMFHITNYYCSTGTDYAGRLCDVDQHTS
jgi:hypothetical protein